MRWCRVAFFDFRTRFHLGAPPAAVFDAMVDPRPFLAHWGRVREVERLADGDDDGVGAVHRGAIRAALPFTLAWTFTTVRADRPDVLEWQARGDLDGHALWQMPADGAGTRVEVRWQVTASRAWLRTATALGRPALEWSHDRAMHEGAAALAAYLDVPLSGFERA
jgi:hypothetical protein